VLLSSLRGLLTAEEQNSIDGQQQKTPMASNLIFHLYRKPGLSPFILGLLKKRVKALGIDLVDIQTEVCFNIEVKEILSDQETQILTWLLSETFEPENFSNTTFLTHPQVI